MSQKILIVEDEKFLAEALLREFERAGYDSVVANTGEDGISKMKIFKPDLVIQDMMLPDMDGFGVLSMKQKDPEISDIPVIVISNSGQPIEIEKALGMGVKDYLIKVQFEPSEVLEKVKLVLSKMEDKEEDDVVLQGGTSTTVVLIEDDALLSELLIKKLTDAGFTTHHAIDGNGGLSLVQGEMPDIVVLDLLLPGTDGFEILRTIKGNTKTKNIPVLLLSNLGHENDVSKGKSLGATNFLIKASVTLNQIVAEIKRIIEQDRAHR